MMDTAATLRDLLELQGLESMQAQSLVDPLYGKGPADWDVFSQRGLVREGLDPYHVAITRNNIRVHARFTRDPAEPNAVYEAYNLTTDPREQQDLYRVNPSDFQDIKQAIRQIWSESRARYRQYNSGASKPNVQLTDEERRRIDGLGYTEAH